MMTYPDYSVGDTLTIEYGEYSDKGYSGPWAVVKDFNRKDVFEEWKKIVGIKPDHDFENDHDALSEFMRWLVVDSGYLLQIDDAQYWFLGSYTLEPENM